MKIRAVPGFERPLAQWTLVVLAVAIVVLAGLVFRRDRGMRSAIDRAGRERDAALAQNDTLERRLAHERSAREAFEISLGRERTSNAPVALALQPGFDPGGKPKQQLRIPGDVPRVQLVLPIRGRRFPRYRASIRPFTGGDELWSHAALQSDSTATRVIVIVPAEVIASGAYDLRLQGIDGKGVAREIAAFTFDVVRQ
jgi:hypothetical protein